MAKRSYADKNGRSKGKAAKRSGGYDEHVFANIELLAADVTVFDEEYRQGELNVTECLEEYVAANVKVSLALDVVGNGVLVTLTPRSEEDENKGSILTGRGSTLELALRVVCFKDVVLCGDMPWLQVANDRRAARPDIG